MNLTATSARKFDRRAIALAAWSLVKKLGATLSEGMKKAWAIAKGTETKVTVSERNAASVQKFEVWTDETPRFAATEQQQAQLLAAGVVLPANFCTLVAQHMAAQMLAAVARVAQVVLVVEEA